MVFTKGGEIRPFLFASGMLYYLKMHFQKRSNRKWLMKSSTRK